eukprot:1109132-Pleurochrysis_carterae.AAC.2
MAKASYKRDVLAWSIAAGSNVPATRRIWRRHSRPRPWLPAPCPRAIQGSRHGSPAAADARSREASPQPPSSPVPRRHASTVRGRAPEPHAESEAGNGCNVRTSHWQCGQECDCDGTQWLGAVP